MVARKRRHLPRGVPTFRES